GWKGGSGGDCDYQLGGEPGWICGAVCHRVGEGDDGRFPRRAVRSRRVHGGEGNCGAGSGEEGGGCCEVRVEPRRARRDTEEKLRVEEGGKKKILENAWGGEAVIGSVTCPLRERVRDDIGVQVC